MAAKKTKKQLADEAWLRNQQLEMSEVQVEQQRTVPFYETVPTTCPACGKSMTVRSGWALIFGDLLQCGGCAHTVEVPRPEFEKLAQAIHDAHPHRDGYKPPPKNVGPKVRGAG